MEPGTKPYWSGILGGVKDLSGPKREEYAERLAGLGYEVRHLKDPVDATRKLREGGFKAAAIEDILAAIQRHLGELLFLCCLCCPQSCAALCSD
jgi:hypothetical protein